MTTGKISITEGSGKNAASYSVSEDAVTKEVQRVALNTSDGVEISPALDGADITTPSPAMPAGGVGLRGWLSAIWTKINGSIAVTGSFYPATQPTSIASAQVASGAIAAGAMAAGAKVAGAEIDGHSQTLGITTGAAVITDGNGTVQQYLRGLIKLAITAGSFLVRGSVASGGIASGAVASGAIVDGANVAQGTTTDAAASPSVAEDTTARTGIGLWKGIKNILILMNAKFAALGQAAMAASMPVVIASDQSSFAVKGGALDFSVNLTVTSGAYTIGDVVGGLLTITGAVSANGKSLLIDSITLSGMTSAIPYELWLLNADLATANVADNGVFALVAADVPKMLGVIPIATIDQYQGQNAIFCASVPVGRKVKAGAATTTIYGYIKATATTSPGVTAMTLNINGRWVD